MKKYLLIATALTMSFTVSACGMHENAEHADAQPNDKYYRNWDHKEHMRMMAETFFTTLDKNGNGTISRKEYTSYTQQWFKEADANHDGKLTLDEVKTQMKNEKAKMKANHAKMHEEKANDDDKASTENSDAATSK